MTYYFCNFDITIHNQKLTVCVTHLSRNLPRETDVARSVCDECKTKVTSNRHPQLFTYESMLHLNSSLLGIVGEKYFLACFDIPYQKYNFPVTTGLYQTFSWSPVNKLPLEKFPIHSFPVFYYPPNLNFLGFNKWLIPWFDYPFSVWVDFS